MLANMLNNSAISRTWFDTRITKLNSVHVINVGLHFLGIQLVILLMLRLFIYSKGLCHYNSDLDRYQKFLLYLYFASFRKTVVKLSGCLWYLQVPLTKNVVVVEHDIK